MNKKISVTRDTARKLIQKQFPKYAHLKLREVHHKGRDNVTYKLGEQMLTRLPSGADYVAKVGIEQKWLPYLGERLQLPIPKPLYLGKPDSDYPFAWSIYQWIEGEVLCGATLSLEEELRFARDLGGFLRELHAVPPADAPGPGMHNFHRGGGPQVYDGDVQSYLPKLEGQIDIEQARMLWDEALNTSWGHDPVWVHGDLACGNILLQDHSLAAIIDFGGMCVGDPACDLVLAWTYFSPSAREVFIDTVDLDAETWMRAKGWCLWKAMYEYVICRTDLDYRKTQLSVLKSVLSA